MKSFFEEILAGSDSTMIDLIESQANLLPNKTVYEYLKDGEVLDDSLSFSELHRKVKCLAGRIQNSCEQGDRVLLLYPSSLDYIVAFFACIYAGCIAVPAYPPQNQRRDWARLKSIFDDCNASLVLTNTASFNGVREWLDDQQNNKKCELLQSDVADISDNELKYNWKRPEIDQQTIAFLQYSSGSTGTPKGVMVTHLNLLHNQHVIHQSILEDGDVNIVGWLPIYHDMGLICNVLQPLYCGGTLTLLAPVNVIQKPYRWLKAITDKKALVSGGPNFIYDLCVDRITDEQKATLDLSHWKGAFNGAEPVNYETMKRFASAFESCGLDYDVLAPCYGLAENTLVVATKNRHIPPKTIRIDGQELKRGSAVTSTSDDSTSLTLVSSGDHVVAQEVSIVDPNEHTHCGDNKVGEIWVKGQSVAKGYWNKPELTSEIFNVSIQDSSDNQIVDTGYMRTGDLGFISEGHLYVTGRMKDVIIVNGQNHYPQDIETDIQEISELFRNSGSAAFSINTEGKERLVVVQELTPRASRPKAQIPFDELFSKARNVIAKDHQLELHDLVLIKFGALSRTTSGKIQRYLNKERYLSNDFDSRFSALLVDTPIKQTQRYVAPKSDIERLLCDISQKVLKVEKVGLEDNFFELGGHSLLLMQIIGMIQEKGLELTPQQVFASKNIADLAACIELNKKQVNSESKAVVPNLIPSDGCTKITPQMLSLIDLSQDEIDQITSMTLGGMENIQDIYPLGPLQQGIHFHNLMSKESDPYVFPNLLIVDNEKVLSKLLSALQLIVTRHDSLRTFVVSDGLKQPVQVVCRDVTLPVNWVHLDSRPVKQQMEELCSPHNQWLDISKAPLLRVNIAKERDTEKHYLVLQYHHLISDQEGLEIIKKELQIILQGNEQQLPKVAHYRNYIADTQRKVESEDAKRFFSNMLHNVDSPTSPFGLIDTQRNGGQTAEIRQLVSEKVSERIRALSKKMKLSPAALFHAAWAKVLGSCTGQTDVVFGTVLSGRLQGTVGSQNTLGVFINTLPVKVSVGSSDPQGLVNEVNKSLFDLLEHEYVPLSLAQKCSGIPTELPLFSALMNYRHVEILSDRSYTSDLIQGLDFSSGGGRNNYPLTLSVDDYGEQGFGLVGLFDQSIHAEQLMGHMQRALAVLVEGLESESQVPVKALSVIPASEQQQLHVLAKTGESVIVDSDIAAIHQLFESQVDELGDNLAVVYDQVSLSYGELNTQANQLAHYLRKQGVGRESRVALYMERSDKLIVGLLAVLKAGGAYVPLDVKWPSARINQIVSDSEVCGVLSESQWQSDLSGFEVPVHYLDKGEAWSDLPVTNPESINQAHDAAYVIYTSGTTGVPKGVVIEHRQLLNYSLGMAETLGVQGDDSNKLSFAHISTIAADLGNTSLYGALCFGGCLHLIDSECAFDPDAMSAYGQMHELDVLKIVPSHLQGLLSAQDAKSVLPRKLLILGGESCSIELIKQIKALSPELRIVNHYGPSETTVGVLTHEISDFDIESQLIPLGRPLPGSEVYVLDSAGQLSPLGMAGELYIGGAGVGRGYINRDELTAERFVSHTLNEVSGQSTEQPKSTRLYRTGDKVRYLPDGNLVFMGRLDEQVKVRGYRVELGEIERCLTDIDSVQQAVVRLESGEVSQQLVAYVVPTNLDSEASSTEHSDSLSTQLSAQLSEVLPDYMLPQQCVMVESIPLTLNGKVDWQALSVLAQPEAVKSESRAAETDAEQALLSIWQAILKRDDINVDDNFFALGGDSILSLQVIAKAKRAGFKLLPKQVFDNPTVESLAAVAKPLDKQAKQAGDINASVSGELPLTPIQHWFFESEHPQAHHWNQSLLVQSKAALDTQALQAAVAMVVKHHDQLRSEFIKTAQGYTQHVLPWDETKGTDYYHLIQDVTDEASLTEALNQAQGSLSLSSQDGVGQLFKVFHVKGSETTPEYLLLAAHHLVVDGVSWRLLVEDIQRAYQHEQTPAMVRPKGLPLADKTTSFKAWSQGLTQAVSDSSQDWQVNARDYWDGLRDALPESHPLYFVQDKEHQNQKEARLGDITRFETRLSEEATQALLQSAPKAYNTRINDLLLSALSLAIAKQLPDEDLYLELEGHGRESIASPSLEGLDISRTVGWFTSRFPVLLSSATSQNDEDNDALAQLIKVTKEQLRGLPLQGMSYGVLRYLGAMPSLPAPTLSFNYLGQVDSEADKDTSLFEPVSLTSPMMERHPENKVTHGLSMDALVNHGQLTLSWRSVPEPLSFDIHQLAEDYTQALEQIITHCGDTAKGVTPSDFPLTPLPQQDLDNLVSRQGIEQLEDVYPLTALQEGLLFHTLQTVDNEESAYFNQMLVEVEGAFNTQHFIQAWEMILKRHSILRSGFSYEGLSEPTQWVQREVELPVNRLDWRGLSDEQQTQSRLQYLQADKAKGFDLSTPPLMRLALIHLDDNHWQVLWSRHHLLLDGWSSTRLLQEVLATYACLEQGQVPEQHPLLQQQPKPFSTYLAWLQQQDKQAADAFWAEYLQGITDTTPSPLTHHSDTGYQYHTQQFSVELTQQLETLAKQHSVTLNTVMQSAWALLLSRYGAASHESQDVVFGMTTSGRPAELSGIENMLGLFINTLPIRLQTQGNQTLKDYLTQTQEGQAKVRDYEQSPLTQIQSVSGLPQGQSLFETLMVFENYFKGDEAPEQRVNDDLRITPIINHDPTHYALTLMIMPDAVQGMSISYGSRDAQTSQVERLMGHYETLLKAMVIAEADTPLQQLEVLSEEDRQQQQQWNDTTLTITPLSVEQLLSKQALQTPSNRAVSFDNTSLTYTELESKANQLAHVLQSQGVKAGSLVGVCQHRSLNMLISTLAVMKAGGAYVPMDPTYPIERLHYMLSDAKVGMVLADSAVAQSDLLNVEQPLQVINVEDKALLTEVPDNVPEHEAALDDRAYVIYTSGSTGKPKGVEVSRVNLTNFIQGMQQQLALTEQDKLLAVTSLSFDIAGLELYLPLIRGAQVVIGDEALSMDGERLKETLIQSQITHMQATPVSWKLLLASGWQHTSDTHDFTALCGGEAFPVTLAQDLLKQPIHVWNLYGPTETTIWSSACHLNTHQEHINHSVPIGYPIANTQLYVLNEEQQPVPIGAVGELYIGGDGVALGYLGNQSLTEARFINTPNGRLYRTGDLARYQEDGTLDCLGRIDHQVKVRGFRIELGEIEQCLMAHLNVQEAVVNPYSHAGEQTLVGYVVLNTTKEEQEKEKESAETNDLHQALKAHVSTHLPNYMVPSFMVSLDSLPLTPNGKIDRKALPAPNINTQTQAYVAPNTETETLLCEIWQEVLDVERVGVTDNFFQLGGHSLLAIRLHARICQVFDIDLPLKKLFEKTTVTELAEQIQITQAAIHLSNTTNNDGSDDQSEDEIFEEFEI
ncbi:amino acid adenylation domain-containing protein [Alteromonadaceae bacterium M269]|nr:amino acid adenylation domain-containing protein [Alteromonadaceae bacterium M269]